MQKTFQTSLVTLGVLLALGFLSCKKEVAGPKGDTGPAGKDGNANVATVQSFVVTSSSWGASADSLGWVNLLSVNKITQDIADRGSVQVFMQPQGSSTWWALPYFDVDNGIEFGIEPGIVRLMNFEADPHGHAPPKPATMNFRVVIIAASAKPQSPGSPAAQPAPSVPFQ